MNAEFHESPNRRAQYAWGLEDRGRTMFRKALTIVETLTAMAAVMGIATMLRLALAWEFLK